jgi:alkanesulfonate monooxygenase SsuD/methylene tetrahydromethanopterin reductase-like flavin-dependent oxidoreductase (luciferase family)
MPYMVEPSHVREGLARVRAIATSYGRPSNAVSAALFAWTAVDHDADWARSTGVATVSAAYRQDFSMLADRYLLIGRPQHVVDRLEEFAKAGVETVLFQIAANNRSDRDRMLDTIAKSVLPAVVGL